jgi:hypothetical protein
MADRKQIKFISPRGIARYPKINRPDPGIKGKEYKVPKFSSPGIRRGRLVRRRQDHGLA